MTIAPESPTKIELPNIVSVDDHVVEPPHLFETWLPEKFKNHPDVPRVERRGLAGMKYLGGTKYDFDWQDDAQRPTAGSTKISSPRTKGMWLRSGSAETK